MDSFQELLLRFDPRTGDIAGVKAVSRHLSDLRGCFLDVAAYEAALKTNDALIYTVSTVEPANGPGDLHYGLGRLMPGRVGAEYYLTKGHLHSWREAAEIYIGLAGDGAMLMEDESESRLVPLRPHHAVYVPGHTAHRTINIGTEPLVYLGVYPARAGHDYGLVAKRNFRKVVIERNGQPVLLDRAHVTRSPAGENTEGKP